jgi:hypothetical protein
MRPLSARIDYKPGGRCFLYLKYGQKVMNSKQFKDKLERPDHPVMRDFYRCSVSDCSFRKSVDYCALDGKTLVETIKNNHNHGPIVVDAERVAHLPPAPTDLANVEHDAKDDGDSGADTNAGPEESPAKRPRVENNDSLSKRKGSENNGDESLKESGSGDGSGGPVRDNSPTPSPGGTGDDPSTRTSDLPLQDTHGTAVTAAVKTTEGTAVTPSNAGGVTLPPSPMNPVDSPGGKSAASPVPYREPPVVELTVAVEPMAMESKKVVEPIPDVVRGEVSV